MPTESDVPKDPTRVRVDVPGSTNTLFLDVGALAPRNAYCALCDTHEYLHRVDLPAYLISPCYHCREWLAREAKISPEILLDLHLRHSIPWPAFLQARFNLPPDGRSIEELISYDCRWRSRQPCRCLVSSGGPLLPPCVEFPWLCPSASTTSWDVGTAASGAPATESQPTISPSNIVLPTEPCEMDPASTFVQPEAPAAPPSDVTANAVMGESKHSTSENKPVSVYLIKAQCLFYSRLSFRLVIKTSEGSSVTQQEGHVATSVAVCGTSASRPTLPCAHRHPRGAPTTCCHGIQFPLLGVTTSGSHCHQSQPVHNSPPTSQPETCPATVVVAGHTATAPGNASRTQNGPLIINGIP
ncbi:Nuclear receptor binding protein [Fasciolopsis buskii]|uniref:Nuclear receptor binding protein n=1 Tax=Fasciolopsis buskii TaxID=27845 RepID=A0A8E0VFR4_9TREM|nr:Nuclear receptor binding protein [Fasciolopsis buski]